MNAQPNWCVSLIKFNDRTWWSIGCLVGISINNFIRLPIAMLRRFTHCCLSLYILTRWVSYIDCKSNENICCYFIINETHRQRCFFSALHIYIFQNYKIWEKVNISMSTSIFINFKKIFLIKKKNLLKYKKMLNYITYYLKWSVLILINEQSTEEKYCNYIRKKNIKIRKKMSLRHNVIFPFHKSTVTK